MSELRTDLQYGNAVFAWLQDPKGIEAPQLEPWHEAQLLADYGSDSIDDLNPDIEADETVLTAIRLKLSGFGGNVLAKLARDIQFDRAFEEADKYFASLGIAGRAVKEGEGHSADRIAALQDRQNKKPINSPYSVGRLGLLDSDSDEVEGWQERALCAQTDPEAFFPEKGGSTREAKKVCLSCDVQGECLEWAMDNDERFGIWGGFSERERRKLKRKGIGASEAIVSQKVKLPKIKEPAAEAKADYREQDRLYSPKPDHGGRIRQLVTFCGLDELQSEVVEFDDDVRRGFVTEIVRKVYHAAPPEKGKQAAVDISRLTNYFLVDDIVKIWSQFDQNRDYWADMISLLKDFHGSIKTIQSKQVEYEVDFARTVEQCMENAQFGATSRTA